MATRGRPLLCAWVSLLLVAASRAGDEEKTVRCFRIELLYTMHANVTTDEQLDRIRALVAKAYPEAKFKEPEVDELRAYYATFRDRLLQTVGLPPGTIPATGYQIAKGQVIREVTLRSIYEFLHAQSKDDKSLKVIFDKLKEKDDPKNPVCGTEPGKTLVVYRDFGGKGLTRDELANIEDGGVKFGVGFIPRVTVLDTDELPKMSRKADTLGPQAEGRQIFRLVAVTEEAAPAPAPPPDRK